MTSAELKTTYNVLCELDYPVPTELLAHIAERVRTTESKRLERRKARMTEEQLIRLETKRKQTLRIYLPDGRWIQKKTLETTFRAAIRELNPADVAALGLRVGRKELILCDPTMARKRIKNRWMIAPGYFLLCGLHAAEMNTVLQAVDEALRLDWEIELV